MSATMDQFEEALETYARRLLVDAAEGRYEMTTEVRVSRDEVCGMFATVCKERDAASGALMRLANCAFGHEAALENARDVLADLGLMEREEDEDA